MKNILRLVTLTTILIYCHTAFAQENTASQNTDILANLDKNHPRLMLKDDQLQQLKKLYPKDETLQRYLKDVLNEADGYCKEPALVYKKIGPRLLSVSQKCLNRMYALGIAYRWTGEKKYAEKAKQDLLAVCDFNDWNPPHFLDTAEMSHAVGLGYDWFYHYLDEQSRQKIKAGLIKNGMTPGVNAYQQRKVHWIKVKYNWNLVCNGGLIVGALAIADTDPNYAEYIISQATASMPAALKTYAPDGLWPEGPSYWFYATRYAAYGISALDSALGNDFGLSKYKGLSTTGLFPNYAAGPTKLYINFGDDSKTQRKNSRIPLHPMFWLAKKFNNPIISDAEHDVLKNHTASPQHIMWYVPPSKEKSYTRQLDYHFNGLVGAAVFRSKFNDPNALFAGIKSGYNNVGHAHLDLGTFWIDALGRRWAKDLGRDYYNLPGYWKRGVAGARWQYYRLRSESHNVPLINNKNQFELAKAKFTKFNSKKSSAFAVVDLTAAYGQFAKKTMRGLAILEDRTAVLVQDEFQIEKPCEVAWGMTTDADITLNKNIAELTIDGKKLVAKILSPANAEFTVESAEQKPPEEPNTGFKRLMIRLPETKGSLTVAVLFSPVWKNGIVETVELKPLTQWK
ncbi:MAG: DUF4962 domain-containing protein [Planctomycetes bacterium]|nr:DUF4962 domain-containing protein [Planctomycetota bacterium]